jgi:hypothetical protein
MADLAKRLVGPAALTATATTLYTVPASTTTIVRSIHIASIAGSASYPATLAIGTAATATNALFYQYLIGANASLDWSGFLVLAAGETLSGLTSSTNVLTITISGIEVS